MPRYHSRKKRVVSYPKLPGLTYRGPTVYTRKPAKPCEDCGRLIRWRKIGDEWWQFELSGIEHWRYCTPCDRFAPMGEIKTWQTASRLK